MKIDRIAGRSPRRWRHSSSCIGRLNLIEQILISVLTSSNQPTWTWFHCTSLCLHCSYYQHTVIRFYHIISTYMNINLVTLRLPTWIRFEIYLSENYNDCNLFTWISFEFACRRTLPVPIDLLFTWIWFGRLQYRVRPSLLGSWSSVHGSWRPGER